MPGDGRARLGWLVSLASALVLAGCGGDDPSGKPPRPRPSATGQQQAGDWSEPGLVDAAGEPVDVPVPGEPTGATLDVTDLGADPAPATGDDAAAIRKALASAEPGDAVLLPPGTFDLESVDEEAQESGEPAHLVLRSGVQLRGAGAGRTILRSALDGDDDSAVVLGEAVTDVVVADLTITSTHDGELPTDPDEVDAGGGPMYGVRIGEADGQGSARVLVEGVAVERFQRHGITVKASREVTVRGCRVADATHVGPGGNGYGIAIEGRADQRDPTAPNDSRHNVVVGNRLDGTHLRHAILLQFPTHHNLVADNVVTGGVLDAIDLHGEGEYGNEVRGNLVTGASRAGIALGNSGGDTHEHGATGEGNWVHSNVVEDSAEGIVVILGTPDTVVSDNRITAGSRSEVGIRLDDAPGTVVRGNTVVGFEPGFVPLEVSDPAEVELVDNRLSRE